VVLGGIGAVLGGIAGGPAGARLGFSVGAVLGGALFPPRQSTQSLGRLSDLRVTGSQYGTAIPQLWGAFRLPGNVIEGFDLVETSKKKGSKLTGTQRVYSYTASFACLICRGPVSRVTRIFAADRTIYDVNATPVTPYTIRTYLGDFSQGQDSLLVAKRGAANVPAYRGTCYAVFQDLPLADWGNSVANLNLSFEVEKWGLLSAIVSDSFNRPDGNIGNADTGQAWQQSGGTVLVSGNQGMSTIAQAFINTGLSDVTIQMTINNRDVTNGASRIIARFVDTNNYLFWGESTVPHHYELVRKQGGLFNTITTTAITPANGDVIKLTLNGSTLQGYVNGVLQATGTETFQQTATQHGFGSASATSTVDDFTIFPLTSTTVKLSDVLADLFGQAGLDPTQYDVSAATDLVDGFILTERGNVADSLDAALRVYDLMLIEVDGKIKAVKRGGSPVVTVPASDLGAHLWTGSETPTARVETRRLQELELPFRLDLSYFSKLRNYEQSSEGAVRYTKTGLQDALTVATPLVFAADLTRSAEDKARQAAEKLLYRQWIEREQFTFALPIGYAYLVPGDVLNLPVGSSSLRVRIIQVDLTLPGPVQCTAVLDDASVLTQPALGAVVTSPGIEISEVLTTSLVAWNGNALVDGDADSIGLYLAANGSTTGFWPGCTIYWSRDAGASYQELATITDGGTIGTAVTALAAGTVAGNWDVTNTVDVNILNGPIPVTTSDSDVIAGANAALLGDEVIQFAVVTALGGAQYRLSRLLRGRRGTDGHWTEHVIGEAFTLLDTGFTARVVTGDDTFGKPLLLKPVTAGQSIGAVAPVSVTIWGEERKPYAPVLIAAGRDGSQNITLTFVRRTRKGGEMADLVEVPLSETTEAYHVYIRSGTTKTITAISQSLSAVVTATAHGFSVSDVILLRGIVGMVRLNGLVATVTAVTTNTFTVNVSSLYMNAYVSGGLAEKVLRTISVSTVSAGYTAAQQTTDGGTPGNPVNVAVAQVGAYGDGYLSLATV
jgi:hypothetical protein